MSDDPMMVAVAAGVLSADDAHRALLNSVAETARAIFGAKAASIFLYDERTDELVFEAVAGSGADTLIGRRLPSSAGIAGWVLVTRQPLVIEDVRADPRFAQDVAEDTGYVPKGIMAVPLLHQERSLGVLEVLDRPANAAFTLAEMDLLGLFANQAAIALDLTQRSRRASEALEGADPAYAAVAHCGPAAGRDGRRLGGGAAAAGSPGRRARPGGRRCGVGRRAADAPPAPPLIRRERRTGPCKRGPGRWPGPLLQECLHAVAVSLDVGLGRILRALVAGVADGDGDADAPRRPAPSTPWSRRPCPHPQRGDGGELRRRPWTRPRPAPCDGARTPTFGVLLLVGRTRKTEHMTDQRTEIFPQVFTNART